MPSVSLWAFSAEKYFFIANKPALRSWLVCFFTGRGRGEQLHLLALAPLRGAVAQRLRGLEIGATQKIL